MSTCWIIGKKVKIESNGHEYLAEPFIVFESEEQAVAACDMVEKVSRERPGITEAAFYRTGSTLAGVKEE